ncbi:hypothetical protein VST7929_02996 [Vibrio stylophorae]|uniref:OmpR/PhoB-type domain-containing protein n=1 Tax=Vibrio stylophorae TaxID=659351 RepID=A0ABM8ZXH6_9VIBR|nr:response regulator transcription factor [Vibrio stylophorae]CAH0535423.1 hypothetical protein VST7929_02996 [Vibrio stylophorae]
MSKLFLIGFSHQDTTSLLPTLQLCFEVTCLELQEASLHTTLATCAKQQPIAVLLNMQHAAASALLKRLSHCYRLPICAVVRASSRDLYLAYRQGADHVVYAEHDGTELLCRLDAMIRARTQPSTGCQRVAEATRTTYWHQQLHHFTQTEQALLTHLARYANQVVSKQDLYAAVFQRELAAHDRSLDAHISNIRKKITSQGLCKRLIKTIRGVGYSYIN